MRLKTLMEEKHLDFNQPLLTVRRLCSTPEIQEKRNPENSAPKLMPLPFYRSELKSGPMSKPGTVPFIWEQAPGRPKSRAVTALLNHTPKLPPGRITQIPNSDKDSDSVACPETSSCSENDDESYLDALDTFSRSGSFFIDSPVSSIICSSEPGRDFMMGRFLPAAKAMASEAPARKPQIRQEQPRPIRLAVNGENKVADNVFLNEVDGDEIEEDYNYGYDDSKSKLCGLLPRFCVLNPVPGLKMPAGRARLVRGRSPYGGSGSYLGSKSRGRDGRTLEGSNLYKRLNENCRFPTQNAVPSATSNHLQHSQPELAKEPEKGKNFLQLLASEGSEWESGSMSPVVEKTLYVVTMNDSDPERKTEESNQEPRPDTPNIDEPERDILKEYAITDPSFMIPPPLPKTPSDSWLLKALDSKKSAPRAYIGTNVLDRTMVCKTVDGPKWETIVKTSKVHYGHLRFSEELLLPPTAESGVV